MELRLLIGAPDERSSDHCLDWAGGGMSQSDQQLAGDFPLSTGLAPARAAGAQWPPSPL